MKHLKYIGNSAYCYSNSTAMLLASIGENIAPSLIEVVGGVGIGAYALPDSNISFLSGYSGLPDKAITRALKVLGFDFVEEAQDSPENPPLNKIRDILKTSPVIFGPVDMGYLVYDPDSEHHHGVDHFVLVYAMDDKEALLHDPAGFPNVSISLEKLALAWQAESIQYKEGYYRYWASPKRIKTPTEEEIYTVTLDNLKDIYLTGEKYAKPKGKVIDYEAITFMANNIEKEVLKPFEIGMLTGFIFPLGARRASDFSDFFKSHNQELSENKAKQSSLLGLCHTHSATNDWQTVTKYLKEYAELEKSFKETLLKLC
jgi:hypothetical protein